MNIFESYFSVDYKKPTALICMTAFALSIPFRILGYKEYLGRPIYLFSQVILPVLCAALMIVFLIGFGKEKLSLTLIPLTLGVISFIFKLFIDPRFTGILHHVVCAILYSAIIVLWQLTVSGKIKNKWVIVILFALPFLFHIFAEDLPVVMGFSPALSTSMWLKEFSMLCIMFGLSMCGMAFEKK